MPNITIRNLELRFKRELRRRAAERGCSLEDEARDILRAALSRAGPPAAEPGPTAP